MAPCSDEPSTDMLLRYTSNVCVVAVIAFVPYPLD